MKAQRKTQRWRTVACLLALAGMATVASAQDVDTGAWVTDGEVNALHEAGGDLFIGGDFSYVGPNTGGIGQMTRTSDAPAAGFPAVRGTVHAAIPAAGGGWYIGGEFTDVGGVARTNLAHVSATGVVTTTWAPNPNGPVRALFSDGTNLYVGGSFTTIGGSTLTNVARLTDATNAVTVNVGFNPNPDGTVRAIVADGNDVYLGGEFDVVDGQTMEFFAEVNRNTGALSADDWRVNDHVYAIHMNDAASRLFIGGKFTRVDNATHRGLAKLQRNGTTTSWTANVNSGGRVNAIVSDGDNIYAGGFFTTVGSNNRKSLVKVDEGSGGSVKNWNPKAKLNGGTAEVFGLAFDENAINDDEVLYVVGNFDELGGEDRAFTGRVGINNANSDADEWHPRTHFIAHCVLQDGANILIGGAFDSIGGRARNNLAKLATATGVVDANWDPSPNGTVHAMDEAVGTSLVVGGEFTGIGGANRNFLARIDRNNDGDAVANWDPNPNQFVLALDVAAGAVYIGGRFTTVGGATHTRIASIQENTGAVDAGFTASANAEVRAIRRVSTSIVVGGTFTNLNGTARNRLGAVTPVTGNLTNFNIQMTGGGASPTINSIVDAGGTKFFVGGNFGGFNAADIGQTGRAKVAELDLVGATPFRGTVTSWVAGSGVTFPGIEDGEVNAIAINSSYVFVGGTFTGVGDNHNRRNVARFARTGGALATWDLDLNVVAGSTPRVNALFVFGTDVAVGGSFRSVDGRAQAGLAIASQ